MVHFGKEAAVSRSDSALSSMKTALEIIAVVVAVFLVIGAGVFLSRTLASKAHGTPEVAPDDATSTIVIGGGP